MGKTEVNYLWRDRRRTFLGLPWSFDVYTLTEDRLKIKKGFLNIDEEEIRLYRIMDIGLTRKFTQRIFGLGTIECTSADKSCPNPKLINVKNSVKVKELLSEKVEEERKKKRVSSREYMSSDSVDDGDDDEHDMPF